MPKKIKIPIKGKIVPDPKLGNKVIFNGRKIINKDFCFECGHKIIDGICEFCRQNYKL